jgi:hypothetical protein
MTRLSEGIGGVPRFHDIVLRIHPHDRRTEDERSGPDPLMAERPADEQIPRSQLLIATPVNTWYDRPIFKSDRWLLRSHNGPFLSGLDANAATRDI